MLSSTQKDMQTPAPARPRTRPLLLTACIAGLITLGVYFWVATTGPRYRADTIFLLYAPTNGSFPKSFPQELAKATPGIIRLKLIPSSNLLLTNGYIFGVTAAGNTEEEAVRAADLASDRIIRTLMAYGSYPMISEWPTESHKVSFMTDCIKPWYFRIKAKLR
jgi:hypothetical protein